MVSLSLPFVEFAKNSTTVHCPSLCRTVEIVDIYLFDGLVILFISFFLLATSFGDFAPHNDRR